MHLTFTAHRASLSSSILVNLLLGSLVAAPQAGCSSQENLPADGAGGAPIIFPTSNPPPPGSGSSPQLPVPFQSRACFRCHQAIYQDWESSMHAHALTSPVMVAQANQVFAAELIKGSKDGQQFCITCHGPVSARYAGEGGELPLIPASYIPFVSFDYLQEGIGCVTCHALRGEPKDSKAASTDFQQEISPLRLYYGPFDDPGPNGAFHGSATSPIYKDTTENLCLNCHNAKSDRNGDQRFDLGLDLFLDTTFDEYKTGYRAAGGGTQTCQECHMRVRPDVTQAADGFPNAPTRTVHDHMFAGVDYPLELMAKGKDPQKSARRALFEDTDPVKLDIENVAFGGDKLDFTVKLTNKNGGHNLPTGFAFMRQMWLEATVKNSDDEELGSSGRLADLSNDLCDSDTLTDSLGALLEGCEGFIPDPQLVNFQTKLVDFVSLQNGVLVPDPEKGHETWLPLQTGGAVSRSRPADVSAGLGPFTLAPLKPFEARSFHYTFSFQPQSAPLKVFVSLLFRNLPPYFVRRLAQGDSSQGVNLGSLLSFDIINVAINGLTVSP